MTGVRSSYARIDTADSQYSGQSWIVLLFPLLDLISVPLSIDYNWGCLI